MQLITWIVAGLGMLSVAGIPPQKQADDALKTLNALFASSCNNRPVLQLSAGGTVVRKDADGGTMTFKLADIGDITIDIDGEAHVLASCKAGATCIERLAAGGLASPPVRLLAFSIHPIEQGEAVLRSFKTLQASVANPTNT
jgi:hypothetical protein